MITDDLVLVAADNTFQQPGIGHVYAFQLTTGRVEWKYRSESGVASDVIRLGPRVYVITLANELICLSLATGRLEWTFTSGIKKTGNLHDITAPAVADAGVFMATSDAFVHAFDAESGQELWKREVQGQVTTTPVVWRDRLFIGTSDRHMYALSPRNGETMAALILPEAPRCTPVGRGETLLVFLGRSGLAALDARLTRVCWTYNTGSSWGPSRPCVRDRLVLVGSSDGRLAALSLDDGTLQWSRTFAGEDIRSIGGTEDIFYIGTLRGMLYACKAGPGN